MTFGDQVHGLDTLYLMASVLVVVVFTLLLSLHIIYNMFYVHIMNYILRRGVGTVTVLGIKHQDEVIFKLW